MDIRERNASIDQNVGKMIILVSQLEAASNQLSTHPFRESGVALMISKWEIWAAKAAKQKSIYTYSRFVTNSSPKKTGENGRIGKSKKAPRSFRISVDSKSPFVFEKRYVDKTYRAWQTQ